MGASGADLEYQRMLANAGIDPATAQGYDAARLEQLGDELGFNLEIAKAKALVEASIPSLIASEVESEVSSKTNVAEGFAGLNADVRVSGDVVPTVDLVARPLWDQTVLQFKSFLTWCRVNGNAKAFVGETGWPYPDSIEGPRWNNLGDSLYSYLDALQIPVCYWVARKKWSPGDKFVAYVASGNGYGTGNALDTIHSNQARVLSAHKPKGAGRRGINYADGHALFPNSGESTSTFSNANVGTYGADYFYGSAEDYAFLAAQGFDTVRLTVRWERLQRTIGGALDSGEVGRLLAAVGYANAVGIKVIITAFGHGSYYLHDGSQGVRTLIGSASITTAHFADFWSRMSIAFKDSAGVLGYDLLNEPIDISGTTWRTASQEAVTAIRATGDTKLILVEGAAYSALATWVQDNPAGGWITDSANNFAYSPHLYPGSAALDRSLSSYADQAALQLRYLSGADASHGRALSRVETLPPHVASNGALTSGRLYITYFTVPADMPITTIEGWTAGTAAAGLTFARKALAIEPVIGSGNLTIVAETAMDTTMYGSTFSQFTRALDTARGGPATYRLQKGMRYAVLTLLVGTTMPAVPKNLFAVSAMGNQSPILAGRLDGQSSISAPGTTLAKSSFSNPNDFLYEALSGPGDSLTY